MYKIFVRCSNGQGLSATVIEFDNKEAADYAYTQLVQKSRSNDDFIKLYK